MWNLNDTFDDFAIILGGYDNKAIKSYASVSGGTNNEASGGFSSISGGYFNKASGEYSSVTGMLNCSNFVINHRSNFVIYQESERHL